MTRRTLLIKQKHQQLEEILAGVENGVQVTNTPRMGRGVMLTRNFERNEPILEYKGHLCIGSEALEKYYARERIVENKEENWRFYFFFVVNNTMHCIDAGDESPYLGRLINHAVESDSNIVPKRLQFHGTPRIIFHAKWQLKAGDILYYDYNDTRKKELQHLKEFEWMFKS